MEKTQQLSVGGHIFDDRKQFGDSLELRAKSTSHLRIWGLGDISAAVLYMPMGATVTSAEDVFNPDVPKALEVKYMMGISGDQLRWVTKDTVAGNGFAGSSIDAGIQEFNTLFRDVKCGDAYCVSYEPGSTEGRLTLSLNGKPLGSVSGNQLSRAILSVWFGKYVWFTKIRDDLLSGVLPE